MQKISALMENKGNNLLSNLINIEVDKQPTSRETYLDQYGIQLDMPTTYLSNMMFYRPDPEYIVAITKEAMPNMDNIEVIDFMKLGSKNYDSGDIIDDEWVQQKERDAECVSFKVYHKEDTSALQVAHRLAEKDYYWNTSIS
jgi:hypothetical protein